MALPGNTEISVRRVRSLLFVLANQSFSAAGAQLGLTQPAVSQHVRQLEQQLGVTLLLRRAGEIVLTPAGAALLPAFRRLAESHRTLLDQTLSLSRGTSGILRIASTASFAALYVAPAFARLRPRFPTQLLDVSEIDDEDALDRIRSGDVDFGFSSVFLPSPGLAFEPLVEDPARAVLAAGHPLARQASVTLAELLAEPVVRFPIGTTSNDWLTALAEDAGLAPQVVCEVRQLVTGLQMVAQGLGVTLVPEDAVRACALPGLAVRPIAGCALRRTTGLVRRTADHMTAYGAALVGAIRAARTVPEVPSPVRPRESGDPGRLRRDG